MDNKFRRPRVSGWEDDGCYITVEYTQENGERVRGIFKRFGWEKAPSSSLLTCLRWMTCLRWVI